MKYAVDGLITESNSKMLLQALEARKEAAEKAAARLAEKNSPSDKQAKKASEKLAYNARVKNIAAGRAALAEKRAREKAALEKEQNAQTPTLTRLDEENRVITPAAVVTLSSSAPVSPPAERPAIIPAAFTELMKRMESEINEMVKTRQTLLSNNQIVGELQSAVATLATRISLHSARLDQFNDHMKRIVMPVIGQPAVLPGVSPPVTTTDSVSSDPVNTTTTDK